MYFEVEIENGNLIVNEKHLQLDEK